MKKRLLCIVICISLCICVLPLTAWAATQISSVTITNVPTPYAGSKVPVSATVNTTGAQLYSLDWYDQTAGRFLESTDYFIENHVYEVQLWVEAKNGYEFRTNGISPNVSATVRGEAATVSKAFEYQSWAMIVVAYTFEPCEKMEIKSVDIQLEGITKPGNGLRVEQGQYIPFSIQSGDEKVALYPQLHTRYHPYGFRWENSTKDTIAYNGDRFQGGCDYYVTIALKPRDSAFTFADNFTATIGGKSAQIKSLGKSYAEITVEVTCIGNIVAGNINPVVSLPRDGNAPDYSLTYDNCEHIDYATVTGWYDVESGTRLLTSEHQFRGGKQYRVEVQCTAAYAYKFQRNANDKMEHTPMITGDKVDSYSFGYDSYRGREYITLVKTFTAPVPDHTHIDGNWQCDESAHKKYCTVCGEDMGGSAHYGGTATCAEKGKCTVCGYAYLPKNEDHTPDTSQWTACGALYHAHLCKLCGAHLDPQDHSAGPAGTPDAAVVCKDCGYIITPAKNHTHKLTKVAQIPAACEKPGVMEHYECDGCADWFKDAQGKEKFATTEEAQIPSLQHQPAENYPHNEEYHWRICQVCGERLANTQAEHEIKDGSCAVCGYKTGEPIPETTVGAAPDITDPTQQTEATTSTTEPTEAIEKTPEQSHSLNWLLPLIIGAVAIAVGTLIATLILKQKKEEQ